MSIKIDRDRKTESFKGIMTNSRFARTSLNDMFKAGKEAGTVLKQMDITERALENIRYRVRRIG